jgi:hypothetical protein
MTDTEAAKPEPSYRQISGLAESQGRDRRGDRGRDHDVAIFDFTLGSRGFNSPARADALRQFVVRGRAHRILIALHEPETLERECPRLLALLRQFPMSIEIHRTLAQARNAADPFIVADDHSMWHQLHYTQRAPWSRSTHPPMRCRSRSASARSGISRSPPSPRRRWAFDTIRRLGTPEDRRVKTSHLIAALAAGFRFRLRREGPAAAARSPRSRRATCRGAPAPRGSGGRARDRRARHPDQGRAEEVARYTSRQANPSRWLATPDPRFLAAERLGERRDRERRPVVLLGQVRRDHVAQAAALEVLHHRGRVRLSRCPKRPAMRCFKPDRIGSAPEHVEVVVALDDERVASGKLSSTWCVEQPRSVTTPRRTSPSPKTYCTGSRAVVRHREGLDAELLHLEGIVRIDEAHEDRGILGG